MGVPVVRGMGPRLPCDRFDARGPRFRERAAQADAPRAVHASEWTDSGLRVELRRRQSAGSRLGDDLHLSTGNGAERRGGPRVAQELLSQAASQLYLVGQSQGPP